MEEPSKKPNQIYSDIYKDFRDSKDKIRVLRLSDFTLASRYYSGLRQQANRAGGRRSIAVLVKENLVYMFKLKLD